MIHFANNGKTIELNCPIKMPKASSFLWNKKMMMHVNCRGYCTSQFMQPEPAKYSRGPTLEATTFMQPEQAHYAHHPGRFFYIRDHQKKTLFSVPHEPVRAKVESYTFRVEPHKITWEIRHDNIVIIAELTLATNKALELWAVTVKNNSPLPRTLSLYPYFSVGNMSWMNQSGEFKQPLNAIVCKSVTPYQKVADYTKNKHFKDITFLYADTQPTSWDVSQATFEGEGGLHNPSAIQASLLFKSQAIYENPCAVLQFDLTLVAKEEKTINFVFGPAKDEAEINKLKTELFGSQQKLDATRSAYKNYIDAIPQPIHIQTPDDELNQFVNNWLARQVFYHGDINRLSTDPQTRNYLQDAMGMAYLQPDKCKAALTTALSQQDPSGAMPDGILIHSDAELKYINQVPHTDHCVWLPLCLTVYLQETGDYDFLKLDINYAHSDLKEPVFKHLNRAMDYLYSARDERGLSYIQQGDWCDPMNMVGYKGKGVSAWLCFATIYAMRQWADILNQAENQQDKENYLQKASECEQAANTFFWDKNWYARGITDDGKTFGINADTEGKIFLNPQSWAFLSASADESKKSNILAAIDAHLATPYGIQMLAPAYTAMRDDIGRVTQKFPGSAENGSVYNHAAAFYAYSLFTLGETDRGLEALRKMIPGAETQDYLQRGQLPVFIPNYYRGAYQQIPEAAGKSSQLFNTGTVHWYLRSLSDGLLGFNIQKDHVCLHPQLPETWDEYKATRHLRGSIFHLHIRRVKSASDMGLEESQTTSNKPDIIYNGTAVTDELTISLIEPGEHNIEFIYTN